MALVPYSDDRLKPKRTKLVIAISITLALAVATFVVYYVWPRPVTLKADFAMRQASLTATSALNCPPQTNQECAKRSCTECSWPEPPYKYCDMSDGSPDKYNATICNGLNGCSDPFAGSHSNYDDYGSCMSCTTLSQARCQNAPNCVWITPRNGNDPEKHNDDVRPFCEAPTLGPIDFLFNYSFNVENANFLPASLGKGHAEIVFTNTDDEGVETEIVVTSVGIQPLTIDPKSNTTISLLMDVNVPIWDFSNTTQTHHHENATEALKRQLIRDICSKCSAFENPTPTRREIFVTYRMNLTATVLTVSTSLAQDRLIAVECGDSHPTQDTTTRPIITIPGPKHNTTTPPPNRSTTTTAVAPVTKPSTTSAVPRPPDQPRGAGARPGDGGGEAVASSRR